MVRLLTVVAVALLLIAGLCLSTGALAFRHTDTAVGKKQCTTAHGKKGACLESTNLQITLPTGVAVGRAGNVFVVDSGHDRIVKISPDPAHGPRVLARWGVEGTGPGQLESPNLIALDTHGNLYVADSGNNRIQKLSSKGRPLAQWGGKGDGPGQFINPIGVAVDVHGNIYVADTFNDRVQKLSPAGAPIAQWQTGAVRHPAGIALDARGDVYVADPGNHRVEELSPAGQLLGQWGASVGLNKPAGIVLDARGRIYIADRATGHVEKLLPDPSGGAPRRLAQWGALGTGPGEFEMVAHGHLNGIAVDKAGNIYVADTGNNRIQTLSPKGSVLAVWK